MSEKKRQELTDNEARQRAEAEADHRLAGIEHSRQTWAAEYHEDRIAELQSLVELDEEETAMSEKNERVLTSTEMFLRAANPEKFRQIVADRTQALLRPGREDELRSWLDARAAADAEWEACEAEFRATVFAKFVKDLDQRFPAFQQVETEAAAPQPAPASESEDEVRRERIMAAMKDEKVFEEVMAENRRLNADEAANRLIDSQDVDELQVPAAMEHLVEELRAIAQTERLTREDLAKYLGVLLRESIDVVHEPVETPESHYPRDATPEQIALWRQQENDPRMEAAAKIARENREHVEMMSRRTLPTMSPAEKQELLHEITEASASITPDVTPTHNQGKIKL